MQSYAILDLMNQKIDCLYAPKMQLITVQARLFLYGLFHGNLLESQKGLLLLFTYKMYKITSLPAIIPIVH